jgi:predicted acylesterase/phospholipase RssA/CRP-like cAMP-binding protein
MAPGQTSEPLESLSHTTRVVLLAGLALAVRRLLGHVEDAAFAELLGVMQHRRLLRGQTFFAAGDPPEGLGILMSGRLQLVRGEGAGAAIEAEVAPGECVGEVQVVTGQPRDLTARAMRDSLVAVCSRADFLAFAHRYPEALFGLVGQIADHAVRPRRELRPASVGATLAVLTATKSPAVAAFARRFGELAHDLAQASVMHRETLWRNDQTAGEAARAGRTEFVRHFDDIGAAGNWVVLVADGEFDAWTERCVRQADRVVVVADAAGSPESGPLEAAIAAWLGEAAVPHYLVLVHPAATRAPSGTRAWLDSRPGWRHLHARRENDADAARIVRTLTGRAVGVVLGGGGARGGAHIGILRALAESRVPIDMVGGTSAGGGIAAMAAYGYSPDEIRDRLWQAFVHRRPLRRWTLPMYGLLDHRVLDATARSLCGSICIEDLWLPFYCVSCDISRAQKVVHRTGLLWQALRATTAVPGMTVPMLWPDGVLVDGGILSNVPVDEMRELLPGAVVAVDVSPLGPMAIDYRYDELPSPFAAFWARFFRKPGTRRIPSIGEVLLRSVSISSQMARSTLASQVDLLLRPPVEEFSPSDFSALDAMTEVANVYASKPVEAWARENRALYTVEPAVGRTPPPWMRAIATSG